MHKISLIALILFPLFDNIFSAQGGHPVQILILENVQAQKEDIAALLRTFGVSGNAVLMPIEAEKTLFYSTSPKMNELFRKGEFPTMLGDIVTLKKNVDDAIAYLSGRFAVSGVTRI